MTSVRKAAPEPVRRAGRRAYLQVGTATAPLRLQPGFIMIGAQRCGTTVAVPGTDGTPAGCAACFHKGINFFDLNYYRG